MTTSISAKQLRPLAISEQAARLGAVEIEYNSEAAYVRDGRYDWARRSGTKRRIRARYKHLMKVAAELGWSMNLIEI